MAIDQILVYKEILNQWQTTDIQDFVLKNQGKFDKTLLRELAEQLAARQKARYKLPTWYANDAIVFPPPLSVEQASSESTAEYKASLVACEKLLDVTGGMGIDAFYFARFCQSVSYIEKNENLVRLATHNFNELGIQNVTFFGDDSLHFLENFAPKADYIYIDPARRDGEKNKVFQLEDCEPNLLKIKDLLFRKTDKILVKTSPLLDISLAIKQLENVQEVHVVAVENEVKELLFILTQTTENNLSNINIVAVNLTKKGKQVYKFKVEEEQNTVITFSKPLHYLYEPNAAIMKSGAFKNVAQRYNLYKLAPNSHLYTSDNLVENFVGRTFECLAICRFDKKEILSKLPKNGSNNTIRGNITTRNFPMSVEEIRKKLGMQEGGDTYLFATQDADKQKIILICQKLV